jgi:hypothetical protein
MTECLHEDPGTRESVSRWVEIAGVGPKGERQPAWARRYWPRQDSASPPAHHPPFPLFPHSWAGKGCAVSVCVLRSGLLLARVVYSAVLEASCIVHIRRASIQQQSRLRTTAPEGGRQVGYSKTGGFCALRGRALS